MAGFWEFEVRPKKNAPNTSQFRNALRSAGFTPEERLVREALQNAVDAWNRNPDTPIRVVIEKRILTGPDKTALIKSLGLGGEPYERKQLFGLPDGNALEAVRDPSVPLPVIQISDFHTVGLGGRWNGAEKGDHFGRLVVQWGNDDKADDDAPSGGSFGFGKTVYAKASRIGTVAYYSVFNPSPKTEGAHARFMGFGLSQKHAHNGREYTGFAFYGGPDAESPETTVPFIDDEAHRVAAQCGIRARSRAELGTTILILDCDLSVPDMVQATEKFWWPRIIRGHLDAAFFDQGTESLPRPKSNSLLTPFIKCMHHFEAGTEDRPKSALDKFNRKTVNGKQKNIGTLSCIHLEETSELANCVALVRQPGMVVNYAQCGSDSYEPCVGLFVAHEDIDKELTYSEPATHEKWDHTEDRLLAKCGPDGEAVVKAVGERIDRSFKGFQREQQPAPPPGGVFPRELGKLLGQFFSGVGNTQPRPESEPRPVTIHLHESRVVKSGKSIDIAKIEIGLSEHATEDKVRCRVTAHHEILGDSALHVVERSAVSLAVAGDRKHYEGIPASAVVTVTRKRAASLTATAHTEPNHFTRIRVSVDRA
jgi:hypothetical protein